MCEAADISSDIFSPKFKPTMRKIKDEEYTTVCKTLTGLGISVPMSGDDNDVGYRDLGMSDKKLKAILSKIHTAKDDKLRREAFDPLLKLITYIQFANDECDFGMGYEFGVDLFVYGSKYLTKQSQKVLPMAYKLLNRKLFQQVSDSHFKNRVNELDKA